MQTELLSGPEKAVLFLLTLDEVQAAPILAELAPGEIRQLREVASGMKSVPAVAMQAVMAEFVVASGDAVAVPRGGVRYLRRLATRALGEARSNELFVDTPAPALERLRGADPAALAAVLENEHPQLVAAVLSQLETERAAEVIGQLPEQNRSIVLARLGTMTEVPASLLEEIATALTAELPETRSEGALEVDGIARSAALVRSLGREAGEALLGTLDDGHAELAAAIRKAMYTFEDLKVLDSKGLRSLLENVQTERLTLALKTASDELKTNIYGSMSKRAAERIKEDLDLLGSAKLADVEAAQQEIVQIALKLDGEGVITLDGGRDAVV